MQIVEFNGTVEESVREVLGLTYNWKGFQRDTYTIESIVSILDNPEKMHFEEDKNSAASEEVREILCNRYYGEGLSAGTTCQLFTALGRTDEISKFSREARFTAWSAQSFYRLIDSNRLKRELREAGE